MSDATPQTTQTTQTRKDRNDANDANAANAATTQAPGRRHGSTPTYHQYAREVPLRPVSVPPIAFGKGKT
jgi:hypothetical protein